MRRRLESSTKILENPLSSESTSYAKASRPVRRSNGGTQFTVRGLEKKETIQGKPTAKSHRSMDHAGRCESRVSNITRHSLVKWRAANASANVAGDWWAARDPSWFNLLAFAKNSTGTGIGDELLILCSMMPKVGFLSRASDRSSSSVDQR